jgi:hypothetical protein
MDGQLFVLEGDPPRPSPYIELIEAISLWDEKIGMQLRPMQAFVWQSADGRWACQTRVWNQ